MNTTEAQSLTPGQTVLVNGRPAVFVTLHSEQSSPGRYHFRALIRRQEAGREREMSVRLSSLSLGCER